MYKDSGLAQTHKALVYPGEESCSIDQVAERLEAGSSGGTAEHECSLAG
jgi:hypothetical protein